MTNYSEKRITELEKKETKDYIRGFDLENDFVEQSIQVKKLFDGISILTNYYTFKLIHNSVELNIESRKKEIGFIYAIYKDVENLSKFLIKNKAQLKEFVFNKTINDFSLEESKPNATVVKIELFDFNNLYNGEGLIALDSLKTELWDEITNKLKDVNELETIFNKLEDVLQSDYYIEDIDEIKEELLKDYSKLDYNALDELLLNKTVFDDKDKIIKQVEDYLDDYKNTINSLDHKLYTTYVCRNFGGFLYINYTFISSIYQSYANEFLGDEN